MSYDLTIRSNASSFQVKPLGPLVAFLAAQPNLKPNGNRSFVFEEDDRWIEIDLETVNEEGDNIEDESTDSETFNCIRAHIPYPHLRKQPERDYFPLLHRIAQQVGWQLYDEQNNEELSREEDAPKKPWWRLW